MSDAAISGPWAFLGQLRFYFLQRKRRDGAIWRPCLKDVLEWCSAIARALSFLHNRDVPVIHRDLKPMNLFLTGCLQLKVGDLGSSRRATREVMDGFKMTGGLGTWRYMAPEMARHEHYNEKVDIYAFGLIMYFMSSGRMPFHQRGADPKVHCSESDVANSNSTSNNPES